MARPSTSSIRRKRPTICGKYRSIGYSARSASASQPSPKKGIVGKQRNLSKITEALPKVRSQQSNMEFIWVLPRRDTVESYQCPYLICCQTSGRQTQVIFVFPSRRLSGLVKSHIIYDAHSQEYVLSVLPGTRLIVHPKIYQTMPRCKSRNKVPILDPREQIALTKRCISTGLADSRETQSYPAAVRWPASAQIAVRCALAKPHHHTRMRRGLQDTLLASLDEVLSPLMTLV